MDYSGAILTSVLQIIRKFKEDTKEFHNRIKITIATLPTEKGANVCLVILSRNQNEPFIRSIYTLVRPLDLALFAASLSSVVQQISQMHNAYF